MSFEHNFCPSPWFSIRLTYSGQWKVCRWGTSDENISSSNISDVSLMEFFNSDHMNSIRDKMINGVRQELCRRCSIQDQNNTLSGKSRQRLKFGIRDDDFTNTFLSSTRIEDLRYSASNSGRTTMAPVDLQIDLSNACNNSCIMCSPAASTKVAADYIKLNRINPEMFSKPQVIRQSWASDKRLLQQFVDELCSLRDLRYIHFLGGETLYIDEFYTICDALVNAGISKDIIIGTTTNGTVFNDKIVDYCDKFREVHLGISVETATSLNDYIRYGSSVDSVLSTARKFLDLRAVSPSLNLILRTTISNLSVFHLDTLLKFSLENRLSSESCWILDTPDCLAVAVLSPTLKTEAINKLLDVVRVADQMLLESEHGGQVDQCSANVRLPGTEIEQIRRVTIEVVNLLENTLEEKPEYNALRRKLVTFLKTFEAIRNNSILDHLPEYEEFLRSYGY